MKKIDRSNPVRTGFHQAKWDEPVIFELSQPGERGGKMGGHRGLPDPALSINSDFQHDSKKLLVRPPPMRFGIRPRKQRPENAS